ncbi:MAG: M28 family metallopeptidase, partial [Candidatus Thermoplasmatota archaeon]|nr:M28 family metallopeptidase [Candidatus Thermoplasmatota archaeon]
DGEELHTYGTSPLNPDTDYDGLSDGIEVKMGYSPIVYNEHISVSNIETHIRILSGEIPRPASMGGGYIGWEDDYWNDTSKSWEYGWVYSRFAGTEGCELAAEYIYNTFDSYGLTVEYEYFTAESWISKHSTSDPKHEILWPHYTSANVVATLQGTNTADDSYYLICAHYDTIAQKEGSNEILASMQQPGADDNAVGVAALLELARIFSQYQPKNMIRFVAFSGEEQGLDGSNAYKSGQYGDNILAVINMDMIGYNVNNVLAVDFNGAGYAGSKHPLVSLIEGINAQYTIGLTIQDLYGEGKNLWSDHKTFFEAEYTTYGAIMLIEEILPDGNPVNKENYHKSTDTIGNIDMLFVNKVGEIALILIARLAEGQAWN